MSSISSVARAAAPIPVQAAAPAAKPPEATQSAGATAKVAKAASAAALPPGSYRNSSGDTVSIGGVVLVDRDGDGGVGLPAPKAKPAASSDAQQQLLAKTYSAH